MADADHKERLAQLEDRLSTARKALEPGPRSDEHYSQANIAWRMVTELVAGLGLGAAIGFGLDTLAGTLPWGLIVFTLLGFVAGVKTMLRTAGEIQNSQATDAVAARDEEG